MAVKVRSATAEDASWFASRLRAADRDELTAASGPDILATLRAALDLSGDFAFVAYEEEPLALFGLASIAAPEGAAAPWMVGTPALLSKGRALMEIGRAYCVAAVQEAALLVNYVDARNTASIRWLQRLGFTLGQPEPFGVEGRPFIRFEMEGRHV